MKKQLEQTMKWSDADEAIDPKDLGKILGIGKGKAREIFKRCDFPIIPETENQPKVDKEMARLYIQGISLKNLSKEKIDYLILIEIRKLTNLLGKIVSFFDLIAITENSKPNYKKGDENINDDD